MVEVDLMEITMNRQLSITLENSQMETRIPKTRVALFAESVK
jgi:hypothetical protein